MVLHIIKRVSQQVYNSLRDKIMNNMLTVILYYEKRINPVYRKIIEFLEILGHFNFLFLFAPYWKITQN